MVYHLLKSLSESGIVVLITVEFLVGNEDATLVDEEDEDIK